MCHPFYIEALPLIFMKGDFPVNNLTKYKICGEVNTTITGKLLYLILGELSDHNGEVVIPQKKISDALRISRGTVSRNLRRLRYCGYIDIQPQYHSDGGRAANKYLMR